jgi:pyridoxal phosphate enzyme (YggS family)
MPISPLKRKKNLRPMTRKSELQQNYESVLKVCPKEKLIAVSKTKPVSDIEILYQLGQRDFGENKVQELEEKSHHLKHLEAIRWHFIGNLQSNKLNKLISTPNLVSIHSIATIKLLNKLIKKTSDNNIDVFLQVNTSHEDEKGGLLSVEEVYRGIELLETSSCFHFKGLMTIGAIRTTDFEKTTKECFQKLVSMKDDIAQKFPEISVSLSMGMSNDYAMALKLGSDYVRIGSSIFGAR